MLKDCLKKIKELDPIAAELNRERSKLRAAACAWAKEASIDEILAWAEWQLNRTKDHPVKYFKTKP